MRKVAVAEGCFLVDIHAELASLRQDDLPEVSGRLGGGDEGFRAYLSDGLHLNSRGQALVHR